jgi:hypothetical protein
VAGWEQSVAGSSAVESKVMPSPRAETTKLITEDAPTVEKGKTEIEFGWQPGGARKAFDSDGESTDRGTVGGRILLLKATHGINDALDATMAVLWRDLTRDDEGILDPEQGNVTANVKWRFFESHRSAVALSWLSGVTAPFSVPPENEPILSPGQDYWSLDNLLAVTIPGRRLNGSLDAGYTLPLGHRRAEDRGILVVDTALGYQVTPWFQPVAELTYTHGYVRNAPDADSLGIAAGGVLNLSTTVRLDLGGQWIVAGRNADAATLFLANLSVTY